MAWSQISQVIAEPDDEEAAAAEAPELVEAAERREPPKDDRAFCIAATFKPWN